MTDAIRTPDPLLEGLPDYPYEPGYRTVDGLRLAHVDEGDGRPVVMFHGEPTWGYLWRHLLPPLRDAGHRVILPDLAGFGRSDKPMDRGWYSYDRHVAVLARCSRTSTSATPRSWSTTGAARSGCGWRWSTPTAWRAW